VTLVRRAEALASALADGNPVMFIEHKLLYNTKGEVPDEAYRRLYDGEQTVRPTDAEASAVAQQEALAQAEQERRARATISTAWLSTVSRSFDIW